MGERECFYHNWLGYPQGNITNEYFGMFVKHRMLWQCKRTTITVVWLICLYFCRLLYTDINSMTFHWNTSSKALKNRNQNCHRIGTRTLLAFLAVTTKYNLDTIQNTSSSMYVWHVLVRIRLLDPIASKT